MSLLLASGAAPPAAPTIGTRVMLCGAGTFCLLLVIGGLVLL